MSSSNIVKFDIGGTVFKTTKSTLTKYDGFFKILLQTNVSVDKDEAGCIFIDRSPKHFDLILNFMRDGDVSVPTCEQAVEEILKEAQFYLLEGLINLCGGAPCGGMSPAPAKAEDYNGIRVIRTPEQLEQLRDRTKSRILIYYSTQCCSRKELSETFLQHWNIARDFVQKHESRFDIFFTPTDSRSSFYTMDVDGVKNISGAKSVWRENDNDDAMFASMENCIKEYSSK